MKKRRQPNLHTNLFLFLSIVVCTLLYGVHPILSKQARSADIGILFQSEGTTILVIDIDPQAGADAYAGKGDNPRSRYYVNMDFYNASSDEMLTILSHYKTYQQTADWSCGNAAALTVLHNFGVTHYTEWDIALRMGSHTHSDTPGAKPGSARRHSDYGTDVGQMTKFFREIEGLKVLETSYRTGHADSDLLSLGDFVPEIWVENLPPTFSSQSLYTSENDDGSEAWTRDAKDAYFVRWLTSHLQRGNVILVEWSDWGGHWGAVIGYDNNGTPEIGDAILIFADPYDTSDHRQDGYSVHPLERWFYNWNDIMIAPKPYQLQPYLVVGRVDSN